MAPLGVDGLLVSFGDRLGETANRAALSFRAAVQSAGLQGLAETAASLASVYLRFDPEGFDPAKAEQAVCALLASRDWYGAELPKGRRLWRIPCIFDPALAPQLAEAAQAAGMTVEAAIRSITRTRLRVQTIGFAPGQPYLGELSAEWDIPRQTRLTDRVPVGALCVAIRQMVLFSVSTPTGWRHVGQTAFRAFRPDSDQPFVLRAGDEVLFVPAPAETYPSLCESGPDGGATVEPIA
ncbi:5-oxoprolinase subunit B family protein [Albidovulum inexpectatum]|uniref:5-oxoprolinase subunit B family protein n=1 Tax=Albidovulum inexpectatum TaxID=196587 RepID=UPI003183A7FF